MASQLTTPPPELGDRTNGDFFSASTPGMEDIPQGGNMEAETPPSPCPFSAEDLWAEINTRGYTWPNASVSDIFWPWDRKYNP